MVISLLLVSSLLFLLLPFVSSSISSSSSNKNNNRIFVSAFGCCPPSSRVGSSHHYFSSPPGTRRKQPQAAAAAAAAPAARRRTWQDLNTGSTSTTTATTTTLWSDFSLPSFIVNNNNNNNNNIVGGGGIETALILLGNKKRRTEFKRSIRKDFPWFPHGAVDLCVDSVSSAFESVAPTELKMALQPGGLLKVRPRLEESLTKQLSDTLGNVDVPFIGSKEKKQLLQYLVRMSLDILLQETEQALAEPSAKLRALEAQRREITKYMSVRQLTRYHIRYHPWRLLLSGLAVGASGYYALQHIMHRRPYLLYRHTVTAAVPQVKAAAARTLGSLGSAAATVAIQGLEHGQWLLQKIARIINSFTYR